MASIPPASPKSSRRIFTKEVKEKLSELRPGFRSIAEEASTDGGKEAGPDAVPQATQETAVAPVAGQPLPSQKEQATATSPRRRQQRSAPAKAEELVQAPTVEELGAEDTRADNELTEINIRLRFVDSVLEVAEEFCAASGARLEELAMLAKRKMKVEDDDFAAPSLWPVSSPKGQRGKAHNRVKLKVSTSMLKRWQKKLDPLELKQPGELAYDAVQHAFNRSVRLVVADLMKRR